MSRHSDWWAKLNIGLLIILVIALPIGQLEPFSEAELGHGVGAKLFVDCTSLLSGRKVDGTDWYNYVQIRVTSPNQKKGLKRSSSLSFAAKPQIVLNVLFWRGTNARTVKMP